MKICCIGAGWVGGPTMAVIAAKCPDIEVTAVDISQPQIDAWNSADLPIFEPGLEEIVKAARGRNLFFSTDIDKAIAESDIIFLSLPTPTKQYGAGAGQAPDMRYIESNARRIARVARGPKIVVEKSTVPVRTAEAIIRILEASPHNAQFEVLSNPEFLAEGTAVRDLLEPGRILIGGSETDSARTAVETLASIYARWVPRERIVTTNLWSSELTKLAANAFLAQRISSINAISAICEATGADVDEVARGVGHDPRIGPHFLRSSVGFGGSCFQKDVLNLCYLCEHFGLGEIAAYWRQVVIMNDLQKQRFARRIVREMFGSVADKRIAFFGFAFKKDTSDTRESAAIYVGRDLLEEQASLAIFDPKVPESKIRHELSTATGDSGPADRIACCQSAEEAATGAHAIVILTEWDAFREYDYADLFARMEKPAFLFDGRNLLDLESLADIGFHAFGIGKRHRSPIAQARS